MVFFSIVFIYIPDLNTNTCSSYFFETRKQCIMIKEHYKLIPNFFFFLRLELKLLKKRFVKQQSACVSVLPDALSYPHGKPRKAKFFKQLHMDPASS